MPRVVFLIYHGMGHFNACFKIAKILRSQYQVLFAGFEFFKNFMQKQGFEYYSLKTVPFGLGFETWVNTMEKKKNIHWNVVKDRWSDRLYKLREAELEHLLNETKPDYLLIDSWQSTDLIVLYPLVKSSNIKIAFIQTMLPTVVEPGLPPLNSLVLPDDLGAVKKSHRLFHWQQSKRSFLQKLKYFGKDNFSMVNRKILDNKIPLKYLTKKKFLFSQPFENIDEFILSAKEFDFSSSNRSDYRHYVGFMIDEARGEKTDPAYWTVQSEIQKKVKQDGCPLIYCSFGSVQYDDVKKIIKFLRQLITLALAKKYVLLISVHSEDLTKYFSELPEDIYIFKSVPQLQVLGDATIFITHGGLNSIKESIYAGVPMLVYPIDLGTDQNGNSSRVIFHQLGLRGDLEFDSSADVEQKINNLLTNPIYHQKLDQMKQLDKFYTNENFISLFKKIKQLD